jgi:tRNA nucleotidyltransferase (CCA-adding enzyme)
MPELYEAEQAARDLLASLEICANEGDDLAEMELEGQLAKHSWLQKDRDKWNA